MNPLRFLPAVLLIAILAACGKQAEPGGEKAVETAHRAPHGGTLVELGEDAYHLEIVRDNVAGTLTVYVLDGHARNPVRLKAPAIELIAMPDGRYTPVSLQAAADAPTGETVGDTSRFEAQADWLKTAGEFAGIVTLEIRGRKFEQVAYSLPER